MDPDRIPKVPLSPLPRHLVAHQRGNGPSDLFELRRVPRGSEQQEQEPGGHWHLRQVSQQLGLLQAHKGGDMVAEEVHLRAKIKDQRYDRAGQHPSTHSSTHCSFAFAQSVSHLSDQHIGCLGPRGQLLHEVHVAGEEIPALRALLLHVLRQRSDLFGAFPSDRSLSFGSPSAVPAGSPLSAASPDFRFPRPPPPLPPAPRPCPAGSARAKMSAQCPKSNGLR